LSRLFLVSKGTEKVDRIAILLEYLQLFLGQLPSE